MTEKQWRLDGDRIVAKEITYTPGLYKIFDEILVNAADNKVWMIMTAWFLPTTTTSQTFP